MAILPVALASRQGVELVVDASPCDVAGDSFPNTGQEILVFTNAGGAPATVTIPRTATLDGAAVAPLVVVIAAASTAAFGGFPPGWYSNNVAISYSSVADLFVKVVKVAP